MSMMSSSRSATNAREKCGGYFGARGAGRGRFFLSLEMPVLSGEVGWPRVETILLVLERGWMVVCDGGREM